MTEGRAIEITIKPGAPPSLDANWLRHLAEHALARLASRPGAGLGILITDDTTIAHLHEAHMGITGPTDILTFSLAENDGFVSVEAEPTLGDIVISHETAAVNAAEVGQPVEREIAFLVLHGILHLHGRDDQTPAERAAMLAEQERLLLAFERDAAVSA